MVLGDVTRPAPQRLHPNFRGTSIIPDVPIYAPAHPSILHTCRYAEHEQFLIHF